VDLKYQGEGFAGRKKTSQQHLSVFSRQKALLDFSDDLFVADDDDEKGQK